MTDLHICPDCGAQNKNSHSHQRHIAICPFEPVRRKRIRAMLEDPQYPGYLRMRRDYNALRGNLPSSGMLEKWCGNGSWLEVGRSFGLEILARKSKYESAWFWEQKLENYVVRQQAEAEQAEQRTMQHALVGVQGWRILGEWNCEAKRWEPAKAERVVMLR